MLSKVLYNISRTSGFLYYPLNCTSAYPMYMCIKMNNNMQKSFIFDEKQNKHIYFIVNAERQLWL